MLVRLCALALLLVPPFSPLAGQARDESRLVISLAMGASGDADLWSVPNQPITVVGQATPDIFALERRLRSNFTVSAQATYFHTPHLGFTGEFGYTGLGTEDRCRVVQSSGDISNGSVCASINGDFDDFPGLSDFSTAPDRSAKAVNLLGGVTLRTTSRARVQPYARALAGLTLLPRNTVELSSSFAFFGDPTRAIYLSDGSSNLRPTGALAIGLATRPRGGSQFRVELRGTWVGLSSVDGPSSQQGVVPPHSSRFVLVPSLTVGFNILLGTSQRADRRTE